MSCSPLTGTRFIPLLESVVMEKTDCIPRAARDSGRKE